MVLPANLERKEPWHVYYKGKAISFDDNIGQIIESSCRSVFSIVITPEIKFDSQENTTRCLKRHPEAPVRWFDMTLSLTKQGWKWTLEELSKKEIPLILPDHTILLKFDPACIDKLEIPPKTKYDADSAHEGGTCTFELPHIIFKGTEKAFEAAQTYACLSCPNDRALHEHSLPQRQCFFTEGSSPCFISLDRP